MLVADSDGTEGRGGFPARAYLSGPGRDLHWGLHGCQQMAETLAAECVGLTFPRPAVGLIRFTNSLETFLPSIGMWPVRYRSHHARSLGCRTDSPAGELVVYPDLIRQPLSSVRAAGGSAGTSVPLDRGHTIILLGGIAAP